MRSMAIPRRQRWWSPQGVVVDPRAALVVFLPSPRAVAYPWGVSPELEREWAQEAGLRIEQAFALCSFASQLVGKAAQ